MTAKFFLAGVDITRPRIEEAPGGPVRILLTDRDDWITVENLADCALLMQAPSDAAAVFIRRQAAAEEAHAAIEEVMPPDLSGDLLAIPANRISDGSDYEPPGYEGEEPLPVLPHGQPGVALVEAGHHPLPSPGSSSDCSAWRVMSLLTSVNWRSWSQFPAVDS